MSKVLVKQTFFLSPFTPCEVFNIIQAFDMNKSLDPNSLPIYILNISNHFFNAKLCDISNLSSSTIHFLIAYCWKIVITLAIK